MATTSDGIFVFPEAAKQATSSLDPNLMLALQNNGGFGNNNWIWILFLWMIWGNNGWGNNGFGGNGSTGYLANQMSNDAGRDLLLQAINGRADAAQQLALATNTSVNNIQAAICSIQSAIQGVSNQVGVTGMQIQNAIQSGDAAIGQQICQAACDNKFAIVNQTNTLQNQLSSNHSSLQLQLIWLDCNVALSTPPTVSLLLICPSLCFVIPRSCPIWVSIHSKSEIYC